MMLIERVSRGTPAILAYPTLAPVVGYPQDGKVKIRFAKAPTRAKNQKPSSIHFNVVMDYDAAAELIAQLAERLAARGRE